MTHNQFIIVMCVIGFFVTIGLVAFAGLFEGWWW